MKRGMPPGGINPVPLKVAVKDKFASPRKDQMEQSDVPSCAAAKLNSQGILRDCTPPSVLQRLLDLAHTNASEQGPSVSTALCMARQKEMHAVMTSTGALLQPQCVNCGQVDASEPLLTAAGGEATDQAQLAKQDAQERLSTIQEGPEDIPSSNVHHPILGKSPMQGLRSQGIKAELGHLSTYITAMTNLAVLLSQDGKCCLYAQQNMTYPLAVHFLKYLSAAALAVLLTALPVSAHAGFEHEATQQATAVTIMVHCKSVGCQ